MRKALPFYINTAAANKLQWGRNLIVAEGVNLSLGDRVWCPLQWGRNLIVAEGTCPRTECRQKKLGFNGAAT